MNLTLMANSISAPSVVVFLCSVVFSCTVFFSGTSFFDSGSHFYLFGKVSTLRMSYANDWPKKERNNSTLLLSGKKTPSMIHIRVSGVIHMRVHVAWAPFCAGSSLCPWHINIFREITPPKGYLQKNSRNLAWHNFILILIVICQL